MNKYSVTLIGLAAMLASGLSPLFAGQVKCPASRDIWVSNHKDERDFNMGRAPKIKLKVVQEFGVIDFDIKALKGKGVAKAWLYVKPAGGHKWGLRGGTDLRVITLATVGKQWVEGSSARYAKDPKGFGATFNESSYTKANWGWPGATLPDVTLGNCETIRCEGELQKQGQGWFRMPVAPRVVKALVAGATHGLFIMDGSTDVIMNCHIHSSNSKGNAPYLMVEVGANDASAPAALSKFDVVAAPNWATTKGGALQISFTVPQDAFSYDVTIDGKAVDRWQIPFAGKSGSLQQFPIQDLPAGKEVQVGVVVVDAAGNRSAAKTAQVKTSTALQVPALPKVAWLSKAGAPKVLGEAKIWAFPEVTKVHPVNGKVINEKLTNIRAQNAVWNGAGGTVRLAAARGEIISFQIALEGKISGASITVSALKGPGEISDKGVKLWRNWYVKGQSEYALPWNGSVDCPQADNKIVGQTLQAVTVDYHIPTGTKAGDYKGTVTVAAGGKQVVLPLKVKVYDVVIPETVFFNPELNCYGGPGQAGSAKFKDSYRLAHYHRCTINRVPYSQSGRTHGDYAPATDPKTGKVTDWTKFDKNLGGLLDGSWFKENPRSGVPVATLYLSHYEGYPLDYKKFYNGGVPFASGNKESMTKHHIQAKAPADALSPAYKNGFVNNVKQFYQHFKEKGWNQTLCQMYMNNKGWKGGYALWTLDEPYKTVDWMAIRLWGELWKQGINDPEIYTPAWHQTYFKKGGLAAMKRDRPTFLYRGDISRSLYQGSFCDGVMTIMYGGSGQRHLRNHRRRMPAILYTYGSANGSSRSNWESAAWCLRAYAQYQDGVLPWQSLGGEASLTKGDSKGGGNALIIDTGKAGFGHAVASFRVHALRRGAQDCELLRLLQLKKNWSREHIEQIVLQRVPISSKHAVSEAASAVTFGSMTSQGFAELKEGVLKLLTE